MSSVPIQNRGVLAEISRTLRPGGLAVFETPNPKNLVVGACNFYADPTHHKPLFPETMQLFLDNLGFERVRVEYLHPVPESPFKNNQPGSQELDIWLFGPRDFAVIDETIDSIRTPPRLNHASLCSFSFQHHNGLRRQ